MMIVDLRSDTVTRPVKGMLKAMQNARVGDDVFGDDGEVNALQNRVANLFGMEDALFFPSGTMANQVAIKTHTLPGDEVICDKTSHVYVYEGGGIAFHSGASVKLLEGNRGVFTADEVRAAINCNNVHFARTSLVCIENTVNRGGGKCWETSNLESVKKECARAGLALHLDGARLWNAMVEMNQTPEFFGGIFESISVCFSKGLGCPVGSVLIGKKSFVETAKFHRKRFGGGMRQVGYLAAACNYALDHHIERLAIDHQRCKQIAELISQQSFVIEVMQPETNILLFRVHNAKAATEVLKKLKGKGIIASDTGAGWIRFVFHLDIDDAMFAYLTTALRSL